MILLQNINAITEIPPSGAGGFPQVESLWQQSLAYIYLYDPAFPYLGIYLNEMHIYVPNHTENCS